VKPGVASLCSLLLVACGGDDPMRVSLTIEYRPPTLLDRDDPRIAACVQELVRDHVHLSWVNFDAVFMQEASPGVMRVTVSAPRPGRYRIRVNSVHACMEEPMGGSATSHLYVNEVLLTRVVSTPDVTFGELPGMSFAFDENGTVSP
jgi:hypothetical protein